MNEKFIGSRRGSIPRPLGWQTKMLTTRPPRLSELRRTKNAIRIQEAWLESVNTRTGHRMNIELRWTLELIDFILLGEYWTFQTTRIHHKAWWTKFESFQMNLRTYEEFRSINNSDLCITLPRVNICANQLQTHVILWRGRSRLGGHQHSSIGLTYPSTSPWSYHWS